MAKIEINKLYAPIIANDTRYSLVLGGRGSGKSFAINTILCLMMFEKDRRMLFLRQTMTSAHISIIPEFQEKIDILGLSEYFEITKTEIRCKQSNSEILFRGIQTGSKSNTANLKSLTGISVVVFDEAEEVIDEEAFDRIDFSVRKKGIQNRVILVMNPAKKQHWIYKRFFESEGLNSGFVGVHNNCTYIHTTYLDNIENLDQGFIDQAENLKLKNIKKYNHLIGGEWSDGDSDNALWTSDLIDATRVFEAPTLKRIVVSVDPAVTSKDTSDETGIIVSGLSYSNEMYVLEDATGIYKPNDWAAKVVYLYNKWKADRVIGEVNNGGDLIETVLRSADSNISYKSVHATRDKFTRAEPVSALYEQGKVHHVGRLPYLEYEMCNWEAKTGDKSPNRIDALVWGAYELGLEPQFTFAISF